MNISVGVLMSIEGLTPVFVSAVLKPPSYVSALLPSCVSIGMLISIVLCGAVLEKKNTATRHILTTAMLALCTLQCFIMFSLVTFIDSASVCVIKTTDFGGNATNATAMGVLSLTNTTCVTPAVTDGYTGFDETNLEASSSVFDVSVRCDTAVYFGGNANATPCSVNGGEYMLSGCDYNSCLEQNEESTTAAVKVCTNPWHGSMPMVFVFGFLLTVQGCCIGYAVYVPPWVFVGQFAGANSGTMAAIYEVSAAIGGMAYLAGMQLSLGAGGWSMVWLLETGVAAAGTVAMTLFTLMDCQGGDEFKGGRFDEQEIRTLFKRIDKASSGYIDRDELAQFLLGTFDGRALPRPGASSQAIPHMYRFHSSSLQDTPITHLCNHDLCD